MNDLHVDSFIDQFAHRRVVFLLTSLDMGGAERQALMLAQYLHTTVAAQSPGLQIEVWGLGAPGAVSERCTELGIPWRSFVWSGNPLRRLWVTAALFLQLRRGRFDLLLPYTLTPNVLAGLFWRGTGAQSCIWNQRDAGIGLTHAWPKRLAVRWTPRFLSNTHYGAAVLAERYGLDVRQITVVPNGVELAPPTQSAARWRTLLEVRADTPLAGMVANLTPYKDHRTLLCAWQQVIQAYEEQVEKPVLALAGRFGPTHAGLVELAQSLGIAPYVRFAGPVADISGFLSSLNVGVLSSRLEGMPNAVLEYMAAGLPVVATDIPSIREIFENSEAQAELVMPGDLSALAGALLTVLRDPAAAVARGAINRTVVAETYSPMQMNRRMAAILGAELEQRS